jgi:outer membrane receptor protein involved in Fe transport
MLEDGRTRFMVNGRYTDSEPMQVKDRLEFYYRGYNRIVQEFPNYFRLGVANRRAPFGATPNILGLTSSSQVTNLTLTSGGSLNSPMATLPAGYSAASGPSTIIAGQWNTELSNSNNYPNGLEINLGHFPSNLAMTASLSRKMTERIELYVEASQTRNESISKSNPFDTFLQVEPTSPSNPFNERVWVWMPLHLTPPAEVDSTTRTVTAGLTLRLPFDWISQLDYTDSKGKFYYTRLARESGLLRDDIASGELNIFVDSLATPPANMDRYLARDWGDYGSFSKNLSLRASGPLPALPWGVPSLTVGLEHRKEGYPDGTRYQPVAAPYDMFSSETTTLAQSQKIGSLYSELSLPIVSERNSLPGLFSLDLQVAGRIDRYSVTSGVTQVTINPLMDPPRYDYSPKLPNGDPYPTSHTRYDSNSRTFGLKYQPVREITLRTSLATAFVPPRYDQLLPSPAPSDPVTWTVYDPVLDETYSGFVTLDGGNPDLKPSNSRSWNAGLIYQPQEGWLRNLRLNAEYTRIRQFDYIISPTDQQVLDDIETFGSRITRDPVTNRVTQLDLSLANVTEFRTAAWDFSLNYTRETAFGVFDLHAARTIVDYDIRQTSLFSPEVDYAGYPSYGGANKARSTTSLAWERNGLALTWTTIWYGSYKAPGASGGPGGNGNAMNIAINGGQNITSQQYHDLVLSYRFDGAQPELLSDVSLQLGIKNLFDTLPPFDLRSQPFYYSPYGNIRMRDFWISAKKRF